MAHQQDDRVAGRFFQCLEQRVGRVNIHGLYRVNQRGLARAQAGRQLQRRDQLADLADQNFAAQFVLVRMGLEGQDHAVGMGAAAEQLA